MCLKSIPIYEEIDGLYKYSTIHHIHSPCAAVWNVSEHREMRIRAILEDGNAREETEKWSNLFVWINLPFTELL